MEVFPLIHSRTGECDYSPQLAVRPKIFNDANISWARSKILPATRNIGSFDGIRRVVASDGKICIAGVVCTMKYFVNNCLNDDEQQAAQPYIDVQGRKYGVFLGYAFKGDAPAVSYSELWQWFNKYLAGEWNRKSFKGVESVAEDCASLSGTKNFTPSAECFSAQIYDAEQFDDKELFDMYLFETAKRNVAFCSNVENIQRVEEGVYNAVTTSAGNIAKLQAHWQEEQDRPKREEAERQHEAEHPVTADAGKKTLRRANRHHKHGSTFCCFC